MACSTMTPRPIRSNPALRPVHRRRGTTPSAALRATRRRSRGITSLRSTENGEPICHAVTAVGSGSPSVFRCSPRSELRGHCHQVRQRLGLHLAHHLSPVCLDCDLADAEFTTNLFV